MMEDFIRKNLSEKLAVEYGECAPEVKDKIDIGLLANLAQIDDGSIEVSKETFIKNGRIRVRYVIETDLNNKPKK